MSRKFHVGSRLSDCAGLALPLLLLLLLICVAKVVDAHGGAARARAPAGCRSGYNTVIWRGAQYGVGNVVADPFIKDDNGEYFFDSIGIDDPSGCTMLNGGACKYLDGSTACHGGCCAVCSIMRATMFCFPLSSHSVTFDPYITLTLLLLDQFVPQASRCLVVTTPAIPTCAKMKFILMASDLC